MTRLAFPLPLLYNIHDPIPVCIQTAMRMTALSLGNDALEDHIP